LICGLPGAPGDKNLALADATAQTLAVLDEAIYAIWQYTQEWKLGEPMRRRQFIALVGAAAT
jgi:hypothetical protein